MKFIVLITTTNCSCSGCYHSVCLPYKRPGEYNTIIYNFHILKVVEKIFYSEKISGFVLCSRKNILDIRNFGMLFTQMTKKIEKLIDWFSSRNAKQVIQNLSKMQRSKCEWPQKPFDQTIVYFRCSYHACQRGFVTEKNSTRYAYYRKCE